MIVGLVFLIPMKPWGKAPLRLFDVLDVIFFGFAVVVFTLMTLTTTSYLAYVSSQTQVNSAIVSNMRQTYAMLQVGVIFVLVGFAGLWGNYRKHLKEIRFR